jgi:sortase (surface protein transpeptidase)
MAAPPANADPGHADMAAGRRLALVAVLMMLLATLTASQPAWRGDPHVRPTAGQAPPTPVTLPAVASFRSTRTYHAVAVPVRLRIPAAGINTSLQPLGRTPDGTIAVPTNPDVAGWYAEGPRPGQQGPAVILGHVDSTHGPAVFFNLAKLPRGAAIYVDLADGHSTSFRVSGLSRVPKNQFPTDLVYLPTLQPSLRLVTCGGTFDYAARHYRDNVIVYADAS